jgi:hypothetical protein
MTSLFLKPVDPHSFFEKMASIAKMPDDDTKWPAHVLSNLHQQLPFLSQYEIDLNMQRVEPEAGFAFGHALLMARNDPAAATASKNPQNMVRIPIIVADRLLQPFHTFELGGNVYPLTAERIESALLNPAMFQGPADQPERQKSLIDQMYPPYQQRQGFGRVVGDGASSAGINKISSARTGQRKFASGFDSMSTADLEKKRRDLMTSTVPYYALGVPAFAGGSIVGATAGTMIDHSIPFIARNMDDLPGPFARMGAVGGAITGVALAKNLANEYIASKRRKIDAELDRRREELEPGYLESLEPEKMDKVSSAREIFRKFKENSKVAGAEDAPNYRPTAGDFRCETCSFFRSLSDGSGYCERFSFQAEPQSVCDEFSQAGSLKQAMSPYTRFGAVGGALGAGKAVYNRKDAYLNDKAALDRGEITPEEYKKRVKHHLTSLAVNTGVGAAAGAGGTAAMKHVIVPAAKSALTSGASFVADTASRAAQKVVNETADTVHRRADELGDDIPLLRTLGAVKKKDSAEKPRSVFDRLSGLFRSE